jgi:hypothetical protein
LKKVIDEELSTRTDSFAFWLMMLSLVILGFSKTNISKKKTSERIITNRKLTFVGFLTL